MSLYYCMYHSHVSDHVERTDHCWQSLVFFLKGLGLGCGFLVCSFHMIPCFILTVSDAPMISQWLDSAAVMARDCISVGVCIPASTRAAFTGSGTPRLLQPPSSVAPIAFFLLDLFCGAGVQVVLDAVHRHGAAIRRHVAMIT